MLFACSGPAPTNDVQKGSISNSLLPSDEEGEKSVFANTVNGLDKYWYQGAGEVNTFELQQNRYRDIHPGHAVLVFVSEDFLTDSQVKNDNYSNPNSTNILKLNRIDRFTTGIYDYSLMSSVFTPVKTGDIAHTLKVTNSSQDWCGQTFSQMNYSKEKGAYNFQLRSYFENEGDQNESVSGAFLEDELMNRIRMGYEFLPQGEYHVIPSMSFLRLRHKAVGNYKAVLKVSDYQGDKVKTEKQAKVYTINYPSLDRTLQIIFQTQAPHLIEGWIDTYPSAFDGQKRSTIAQRKNTVLEPYWSLNSASQTNLRAEIGIK